MNKVYYEEDKIYYGEVNDKIWFAFITASKSLENSENFVKKNNNPQYLITKSNTKIENLHTTCIQTCFYLSGIKVTDSNFTDFPAHRSHTDTHKHQFLLG